MPPLLGFSDPRRGIVWFLAGKLPVDRTQPQAGYHRIAVNYFSPGRRFVTLYGWAEEADDPLRVAWLRRQYSGCLLFCTATAPILLKVHAEKAIYADTDSNGMSYLWERARSEGLHRSSDPPREILL